MRTVLLSSVAALALTFATGSLSHAQAPAPSDTTPGASTSGTTPDQSPDQSASGATTPTPTPTPTQVKHHHRMHRAANAESDASNSDHWAHQPGTGESGPASTKASNIDAADTHSDIAPHFPEPAVGPGASPDRLLQAADAALASHRTGTADQALEMAETRLLDRSTPVSDANQPDGSQRIRAIESARKALASGNTSGAEQAIQMAMAGGGGNMGQGNMGNGASQGGANQGGSVNGGSPGGQGPVQSTPGSQ